MIGKSTFSGGNKSIELESQINSATLNPSDLEMEKKRLKTILTLPVDNLRKGIEASADKNFNSARKKKTEDDTTHRKKPTDIF